MGNDRNGPLSGSWAKQGTFISPEEISDSATVDGTDKGFSRGDHVHAHGDRGGGTLHAQARRNFEDDDLSADGFAHSYQDFRHRRFSQMTVDYLATTVTTFNMPTITITAATLGSNTSARGGYLTLTTSSASGNAAVVKSAVFTQPRMDLALGMAVRTGSSANTRNWFGLFDATPETIASNAAASSGLSCLAFAYDSGVAAGGNWQVITSDGTSQTTTDTGVPFVANKHFALEIETERPTAADVTRYYIDGTLVASITTTLPAGITGMMWAGTRTNLTTTAHNFRMGIVTLTRAG